MSARWQAGDMAWCIKSGPWWRARGGTMPGPECGQVLQVVAVRWVRGVLVLGFEEWRPALYQASCFKKVTPPEADEFDREIIAALSGKPEQVSA